MMRLMMPIAMSMMLAGCGALDPVNLYLAGQNAMYEPPPHDPMAGITRTSAGATPEDYRKFNCPQLAKEAKEQKEVDKLVSDTDKTGKILIQWHLEAIAAVQKEKKCST